MDSVTGHIDQAPQNTNQVRFGKTLRCFKSDLIFVVRVHLTLNRNNS